jgi:Zn-dependent M28 family amino/carboxypeptidase
MIAQFVRKATSLMAVALSAVPAFAQSPSLSPAADLITPAAITAHIRFLADDLLEGRGPGTRGDKLTQLYIATQFEQLGLLPAGEIIDNAQSWLQPVPLLGITTQQPPSLTITSSSASIDLLQHDDFIAVSGTAEPTVHLPKAPIVFVGYGITAPEYHWDDYADVDVSGKVVLIMNNDPEDDPNLFEGRRRLYYGRWDYKYANAAAHGAAGAIIIHTEASAGYPFSVVQTSWSGEESELRGDDSPRLKMKSWFTEDASRKLVACAGYDLDTLRTSANQRGFKAVDLKAATEATFTCSITQNDSANVLATLPGSDPALSSEYVIVMAHHDHLGIAVDRDKAGDSIYNGAIDNASGTAAMLAIAKAFAQSEVKPKRSILFAAVCAEEQGLLGSEFFAAHPTISPAKIAGLVNMDSLNFLGRTLDLQVVGYGKSSIDSIVEAVAGLQNRKVVPDQFIDRGYFYRSDQFSLAKIGVPGLYLHAGTAVRDRPDGWGREQQDAWTKNVYHQPADEFRTSWDMSGMVEDSQLLFEVTRRMANADQMQSWNPGDEFEAIRKSALEVKK